MIVLNHMRKNPLTSTQYALKPASLCRMYFSCEGISELGLGKRLVLLWLPRTLDSSMDVDGVAIAAEMFYMPRGMSAARGDASMEDEVRLRHCLPCIRRFQSISVHLATGQLLFRLQHSTVTSTVACTCASAFTCDRVAALG